MVREQSASTVLACIIVFCALALSGCLSPISLTRAVIAYDDAIIEAQSKQLLVNIARAQHHQPIHFTGVSNVAATFDFRFTAGTTPALTGDASRTILPVIGGSVAENPTISIAPIEGEEFTQRLLTPFHEAKLTLLLRQGIDIDLLLRLMAKELRLKHNDGAVAHRNNPSDTVGYEMFRRVVLHLSAIQDHNSLYVEPLSIERSWTIPADSVTAEGFKALEQDYQVEYNGRDKTYTLRKLVEGGTLITNYDRRARFNLPQWAPTHCHEKSEPASSLTTNWVLRTTSRLIFGPDIMAVTGHSTATLVCEASMPC